MSDKHVISPGVRELLYYLKDRGVINGGRLIYNNRRRGINGARGSFRPKDKYLEIEADGPDSGDFVAVHEAVHALLSSGEKSRTKTWKEMYDRLPFLDKWKGVTIPKHWTRGEMGNPLIDKTGIWSYPGTSPESNPVVKYGQATSQKRKRQVVESIEGEDGSWSGIRRSSPVAFSHEGMAEESQAYYLTDPKVKEAYEERLTQLGMFLYDYSMPDELVDGVLRSLRYHQVSPDMEPEHAKRWRALHPVSSKKGKGK